MMKRPTQVRPMVVRLLDLAMVAAVTLLSIMSIIGTTRERPMYLTAAVTLISVGVGARLWIMRRNWLAARARATSWRTFVCEKCGYDLRASRDGTCTECGHRSEKVREMAELAGGDLQRFRREGDPD